MLSWWLHLPCFVGTCEPVLMNGLYLPASEFDLGYGTLGKCEWGPSGIHAGTYASVDIFISEPGE